MAGAPSLEERLPPRNLDFASALLADALPWCWDYFIFKNTSNAICTASKLPTACALDGPDK